MALTLAQAAVTAPNMIARGVIETFIDESPVLSRMPFMEIEGNAFQYTTESSLPGIAFRAVNAGYTESTGALVNATVGLKIMGGDADVDRFLERVMSNFASQRARQTRLKAKAAAIKFTENFFEGDAGVDVNSWSGLRTTLTGTQVITAGANGAALTLTMVDDLLAAVDGADVIYAHEWLIRKVDALRRAAGGVELERREMFGKPVAIYAGVPIVNVGNGLAGTPILGFDETQGASALTSSMYAVKWGEEEYVSGLTNGGIDVYDLGELETKPAFRTRIEWYNAIAIFNARGAARLKGILQS